MPFKLFQLLFVNLNAAPIQLKKRQCQSETQIQSWCVHTGTPDSCTHDFRIHRKQISL